MEEDFNKNMRKTLDYKKIREDRVKAMSKQRLLDISSKKIRTTMIGALASIEEKLGWLWKEGNDKESFKQIFDEIRSEILDKGNNQIRNLETEFSSYDIVWKKNSVLLPIMNKDRENDR